MLKKRDLGRTGFKVTEISFALDIPGISSVVLGGKTPAQVEGNNKVASLPPLSSELCETLTTTYHERGAEFNIGE